ncbi:hypothetical protein SSX86_008844 [Deinandra increscens subsp. villosa]|uniref:Uncharacterized protein n=1 Tax=Deinandra increscens subsp. villosa TaxID=3103831 RepID=A0AAP0DG06_9ASTR
MKQMQLLVRVQTQIQSQRIQMLKSQAHKPQPSNNNSHPQSEMGDEYWDDSLITKEEKEARLKRKEDAAIRREKAMAYAYSHQPHLLGRHKLAPTSSLIHQLHQTDRLTILEQEKQFRFIQTRMMIA